MQYSLAFCSRLKAVSDVISARFVSLIATDKPVTRSPPNGWNRQNTAPLNFDPMPSEVAFHDVFRTLINADRKKLGRLFGWAYPFWALFAQYLTALSNRLAAASYWRHSRHVCEARCSREECTYRSREILPEAVRGGIFDSCFFRDNFRPEVVSDVIARVVVDIRADQFVMDDDDDDRLIGCDNRQNANGRYA